MGSITKNGGFVNAERAYFTKYQTAHGPENVQKNSGKVSFRRSALIGTIWT